MYIYCKNVVYAKNPIVLSLFSVHATFPQVAGGLVRPADVEADARGPDGVGRP